ncbi:MAG: zf-HC2 domain-containing protein [Burkholderiales bacterium]
MSCARTRQLIDAWIDNELDRATQDEIGRHLNECPACATLRAEREAVRDTIRAAGPREAAPPVFTAALRRALAREIASLEVRRRGPSWWQAAAFASAAGLAGALATLAWVHSPRDDAPRDQAVASHVAALAVAEGRAERLVQVAASDRHVVRPWFQGRVDFAPPVRDLASEGFTLLGARLDRIGDRNAAVVVYRIRNHPIDLFVWRGGSDAVAPVQLAVARGFSVATWEQQGLRFAAVSDVDSRELERFARALQSPP